MVAGGGFEPTTFGSRAQRLLLHPLSFTLVRTYNAPVSDFSRLEKLVAKEMQ